MKAREDGRTTMQIAGSISAPLALAASQRLTQQSIHQLNKRTNLVLVPEHHVLTDGPAYGLPVADDELEPRHFLPENLGEALG